MYLLALCSILPRAGFTKTMRIMRLTALFLFAACLHVSATGFAQTVTLQVQHEPIEKVFRAIQAQTGYTFVYLQEDLQQARPVDLHVAGVSLAEALDACFEGQPFTWTIVDKYVVVKQRVAAAPVDTGRGGGIKVRGVVLTEAGVPVQGANVTVKKTEKGTITNAKGEFELSYSIPVGSVLIFSFVGYSPQNFMVKDGGQIRIYMMLAQNELDKAVVKAYGMTTQRLTTADIGTVTAEEIERQPVMNPLLALEGKVAGLDVNMTSGYASAPVKVELRGRATINPIFPSDPLYIIDGVPLTINELNFNPYNTSSYATGSFGFDQLSLSPAQGQSLFFSINPADIESIQVLKDADATAIYGSRGANGVILVTTKKGKAGKTIFNLNGSEGVNRVDRFWDMMNIRQYLVMRRQAFYNTGSGPSPLTDWDVNGTWDTTRNTNWQKILWGGVGRNINIQGSLSGGDARTTFRVGGGYSRNTGITAVSGADQRASVSLSLSHNSLDNKLSVTSLNGFSYTQSNMILLPGNVLMPPDAPPIYDSLGNLN